MWLLLVLKNIKYFVKNKPIMFLFVFTSQILCVVTVLTATGMMYAITPQPQDERSFFDKMFLINFEQFYYSEDAPESAETYTYLFDKTDEKFIYAGSDTEKVKTIEKEYYDRGKKELEEYGEIIHSFSKYGVPVPTNFDSLPTYGEIKKKIGSVLRDANGDLIQYYINGYVGDSVEMNYMAEDGAPDYMRQNNQDIVGEDPLIVVRKSSYLENSYQHINKGDIVTVGKERFKVSAIEEQEYGCGQTTFHFLFGNTGDAYKVSAICLIVKDSTELKQIQKIKTAIDREFGTSAEIEVPQPKPLLEKQLDNMIYVISVIIMLVVLINILRFYSFILSSRKGDISVFLLCGANRLKIIFITVIEIILTLFTSFLLGLLLFHFVLINPISQLYPSFSDIFDVKMYLIYFGMYMLLGIIIMLLNMIPILRNRPTDIRKE